MRIHPKLIILIGFLMVLFGFLAPFLMVIKVLETTYLLSFLSYGFSVAGLMLGVVGAAMYSRINRDK